MTSMWSDRASMTPWFASPLPARRRADRRAVSLLELIIVVSIVGTLTAAGVAGLNSVAPMARQRNEAHELLSAIRYAQQLALAQASLGSGIQCRVNFPNANEFGLELVDPTRSPPSPPDPGVTVAARTDNHLGLLRRIGSDNLSNNQVGSPENVLADRMYFTNAAGDVRVPTGAPNDRIVYQGRAGPTLLPWTGPPTAPIVFDRIVLTNHTTLPPPPGIRQFVIRLDHWAGQNGSASVAWMEVSLDEVQRIP